MVFAAVLGLPVVAAAAGKTALDKPGLQEFYSSLKGDPEDRSRFRLIGPDVEKCVRFEPAGLRITLPQGYPGFRSATGVLAYLSVGGDFEITVHFEILAEPGKQDVGSFGTRLSLQAGMEKPELDQVKFSRAVQPGPGSEFLAYSAWWRVGKSEHEKRNKPFATTAKTGRLRMLRDGGRLSFLAAEAAGDFSLLREYPFSAKDLQEVAIYGFTDNPRSALDARVTDLRIRADSIGKAAAAPGLPGEVARPSPASSPAEVETPVPLPVESKSGARLVPLAGLTLVLAMTAAAGVWLYLRQTRRKEKDQVRTESSPAAVSFACPECGKTLKARVDLAGKKVRCTGCDAAAVVPVGKVDETSRIPS